MDPRTNDPHPSTTTHTPDPRATHRGRRRRRPGRRPGPLARLRTVVGAVLALALATVTLVLVPGAAPAGAGDEWATEVTRGYNDDGLPGQKAFGDLPVRRRETIDGYKYHFDDDQWLMIRASGTEPVLRTYAESSSLAKAHAILAACKKAIGA